MGATDQGRSSRRWARSVRRQSQQAQATPRATRPTWCSDGRPDPRKRCLVCGSFKLDEAPMGWPEEQSRMFVCCQRCRYVHIPENHRDYAAVTSTENLGEGIGARMGTWEVPGREYQMVKLALQVLGRKDLSVLMFGSGRSIDNHHAAKHPRVSRVAIGDMVKLRDDAEFVDINHPGNADFDVVVASEVLEHFPDPYPNFENLFSQVTDDGIIICGTNVRDGLPMEKVTYMRYDGHVSYWSPKSLRIVAEHFGMLVDYRTPKVATGYAGPRKKYIIFSRSRDVMNSVVDWFGAHMYAPSDRPDGVEHDRPAEIPTGIGTSR